MKKLRFKIQLFILLIQVFLSATAEKSVVKDEFEEILDSLFDETTLPHVIRQNGAKLVKHMMNLSADPCEDFYEFSCGNFGKVNKYDRKWGDMIVRKMFEVLQDMLLESEERIIGDSENSYFRDDPELSTSLSDAELKAKYYYESCIDMEAKKELGMEPARNYLNSLVGEPFRESYADEELKQWINLAAELTLLGEKGLFTLKTCPSYPYFDSGDLVLQHNAIDGNVTKNLLELFRNLGMVTKVLRLYDVEPSKILKTAYKIIHFEKLLAKIQSLPPSPTFERLNLRQLNAWYPAIDWETYLEIVDIAKDYGHILYNVSFPIYMTELNAIIAMDSPTTIYNYLQFRIAKKLLYFTDKMHKNRKDLKEFCFHPIKKFMDSGLTGIALRRFLSKPIENGILQIINAVDDEFVSYVSNLDGISDFVKNGLIEKAANTPFQLASTDPALLTENMKMQFRPVNITNADFFSNALEMQRYIARTYDGFSDEYHDVLRLNAFYDDDTSTRRYALGYLIPNSFHLYLSNWNNYGNLGNTIGHELSHAFDSVEFFFKPGNRAPQDLDFRAMMDHLKQTSCLLKQFNSTGPNTIEILGENSADLGGLIIAFETYKRWLKENEELAYYERPDNLNLTPKQLYFVSYAQNFCDRNREGGDEKHASNSYRVISSIKNFKGFADEFQCLPNSPMNPSHKCNFL